MFLLKAQIEYFGLKVPIFSWVVSLGLIGFSLAIWLKYFRICRVRRSIFTWATDRINALRAQEQAIPGSGISIQLYQAMDEMFRTSPLLRTSWQNISSYVVRKVRATGEHAIWITKPSNEIVGYDSIINIHSYKTAPAIISGVGLLATFLAILVALIDVRFTDNRIQGLDLLVQGLSGKFLSSVVALSCATLLLATENLLFSPLRKSFASLIAAVTAALPQLTEAQILCDLQDHMSRQSDRLETFFAGFPLQMANSFSAATTPTFARMTTALEDLNTALRTQQERAQESTGEQLKTLLTGFDKSLQAALEDMALRFNESLSSNTQGHFDEVAASLNSTGALLQQMNEQFSRNQRVLSELIDLAKDTATDQMAMGRTQAEQLTAVLTELMTRLQEKTGESVGYMERTVSAITSSISDTVSDLTAHMAATVQESSETSAKSAKQLLNEAGALNARTAVQLSQLMDKQSTEMVKVDELKSLLEQTIRDFTASLSGHTRVTSDLHNLASEVNQTMFALHDVARLVTESQDTAMRVSAAAADHLESARVFSLTQREVWSGIQESMIHYESLFERVEGHAKDLLTQIGVYLGNYSDSTQKHFTELTSAANNFMAEATGRLAGSVDELGEQLDELQTSVAGIVAVSKTMVRHAAA